MPDIFSEKNIQLIKDKNLAHHLSAQPNLKALERLGGGRIISHGKGIFVYDDSGRRLMDGMAGLWCVAVGYGREELADVAAEQIRSLSYYNTFFQTSTPPTVDLAEKISSKLDPTLSHVFFANSGSEAVDSAIRFAHYYWKLCGLPERRHIISRHYAYHGSSIFGAGSSGLAKMREQSSMVFPEVHHVDSPYLFRAGKDVSAADMVEIAVGSFERKILEIGPDKVAAFIGEPVQGAGGVIIPPDGYWPRVEEICRRYDILLIADEVICGFGRTGSYFGHQKYGFTPDMVTMAKGLSSGYVPISAVAINNKIVDVLRQQDTAFIHGYTYSGHPMAAAIASRNLDIIDRENLVQRTANEAGPAFKLMLEELASEPAVGEVRSVGLIGAIELTANNLTQRDRTTFAPGKLGETVKEYCWESGLIVRAIGDVIAICPPLVIVAEEIDEMGSILKRSLRRLKG